MAPAPAVKYICGKMKWSLCWQDQKEGKHRDTADLCVENVLKNSVGAWG